jgi:hypothetical protein
VGAGYFRQNAEEQGYAVKEHRRTRLAGTWLMVHAAIRASTS